MTPIDRQAKLMELVRSHGYTIVPRTIVSPSVDRNQLIELFAQFTSVEFTGEELIIKTGGKNIIGRALDLKDMGYKISGVVSSHGKERIITIIDHELKEHKFSLDLFTKESIQSICQEADNRRTYL